MKIGIVPKSKQNNFESKFLNIFCPYCHSKEVFIFGNSNFKYKCDDCKKEFDNFQIGKMIENGLIKTQELTEEEYQTYLNLLSDEEFEDYRKANNYLKEVFKK